MRRWCAELQFVARRSSIHPPRSSRSDYLFTLYSSPLVQLHFTRAFSVLSSTYKRLSDVSQTSVGLWKPCAFQSPFLPVYLVQVRHSLVKYRKRLKSKEARAWRPLTPRTSKFKLKGKRKHKPLSSLKGRFCLMHDGRMLRRRANRRHRRSKMQKKTLHKLKKPVLVCPTWANKIKKDGFKGKYF